MSAPKIIPVLCLALVFLGACGALSAGAASREAPDDVASSAALERRLDLLERRLDALRGRGSEQGLPEEGRDLLADLRSLHDWSLGRTSDPEAGTTDWIEYAMLMLLGAGGLYSERRRTGKERDRLHARLDKRKGETAALQAALAEMRTERGK